MMTAMQVMSKLAVLTANRANREVYVYVVLRKPVADVLATTGTIQFNKMPIRAIREDGNRIIIEIEDLEITI